MTLGLDYSAGRPTGAAVAAAGYRFVARYLTNGLSGRFNLTAAEAADMRRNGVDVAVVWERKLVGQPDRATEGAAAGVADAKAADVQCNAVGLAGWPVYMAVDFDVPDYAPNDPSPRAKLGPVGDYLAAARDVLGLGRAGVYGGYWAVKRALDAGLVTWGWQTMAWSGGNIEPRAHLLQRIGEVTVGGVGCDVNEARKAQFGQAVAAAPIPSIPGDIVFEFVVNGDTFTPPNGNLSDKATTNSNVLLLLGGGYAAKATWADVQAKDKSYGGDGTGSVLGKPAAGYQAFVDLDAAVRARDAHLTTLPSAGGGSGASKADVEQVVDAAFADHNATLTYNKITQA